MRVNPLLNDNRALIQPIPAVHNPLREEMLAQISPDTVLHQLQAMTASAARWTQLEETSERQPGQSVVHSEHLYHVRTVSPFL